MRKQEPEKWICNHCWSFLSRRENEALASVGEVPARTSQCVHCHAIGAFVSETSDEGSEFVNDLTFDVYAAALMEAGYEIELYCARCNHKEHQHCTGQNLPSAVPATESSMRLTHMLDLVESSTDGYRLPGRCLCPCHNQKAKVSHLQTGAIQEMKSAWLGFNEPLAELVRSIAQNAGMTNVEARSVAARVAADIAMKLALQGRL